MTRKIIYRNEYIPRTAENVGISMLFGISVVAV